MACLVWHDRHIGKIVLDRTLGTGIYETSDSILLRKIASRVLSAELEQHASILQSLNFIKPYACYSALINETIRLHFNFKTSLQFAVTLNCKTRLAL
jgi:hypothetical protein